MRCRCAIRRPRTSTAVVSGATAPAMPTAITSMRGQYARPIAAGRRMTSGRAARSPMARNRAGRCVSGQRGPPCACRRPGPSAREAAPITSREGQQRHPRLQRRISLPRRINTIGQQHQQAAERAIEQESQQGQPDEGARLPNSATAASSPGRRGAIAPARTGSRASIAIPAGDADPHGGATRHDGSQRSQRGQRPGQRAQRDRRQQSRPRQSSALLAIVWSLSRDKTRHAMPIATERDRQVDQEDARASPIEPAPASRRAAARPRWRSHRSPPMCRSPAPAPRPKRRCRGWRGCWASASRRPIALQGARRQQHGEARRHRAADRGEREDRDPARSASAAARTDRPPLRRAAAARKAAAYRR